MNAAFNELKSKSPIVMRIVDTGGTVEDCAVALHERLELCEARILKLESIAPKKIRTRDERGHQRVWIWRCPEELIPEQ